MGMGAVGDMQMMMTIWSYEVHALDKEKMFKCNWYEYEAIEQTILGRN